MKIKVIYTDDPTGMSKDKQIIIKVPKGLVLFHGGGNVYDWIPFEKLGIPQSEYLHVWKIKII